MKLNDVDINKAYYEIKSQYAPETLWYNFHHENDEYISCDQISIFKYYVSVDGGLVFKKNEYSDFKLTEASDLNLRKFVKVIFKKEIEFN